MPSTDALTEPDWQPDLRCDRVHLRPIRADDLDGLHAAANDPLIWAQHSETNRHERAVFEKFFAGAVACGGGMVAFDPDTGRLIGSSRFYDWNASDRTVVIGYSFLERARWGDGTNRQMKRLMLDHAFRWAATVWFHVSPGNLRSQKALERIGAMLHDRQQVMVGGVPSPRLIYAMRPGDVCGTCAARARDAS
ncbi:MAG: GNAT family N-acetyltransferase, partial [Planctomycetota bacterium]